MKENLRISFDILEDWGFPSVTDYCRYLVENIPEDKLDFKIEVYRGEMLCLTVNDIQKAATLQPDVAGWRKVKKDRAIRVAEGQG
jgi:hypothetical protein